MPKAQVKGLLKKWVAGRVKKYGFKGCIYRLGDEIVKATTIMNFGKNESVNGIACIKAVLKHLRIIESDKMTNPFETLSNNEKEKMRSLINDLLI